MQVLGSWLAGVVEADANVAAVLVIAIVLGALAVTGQRALASLPRRQRKPPSARFAARRRR